ncbi:MAG: hypothetical protein A2087_06360 [Spirochaetes bacterium GWD1_61_31]|nr:MAG: hypothetical protein A2Y37_09110 [Spirochaetes bacterium GWB1_60_80]OHD30908.1 MAG: hypothetical protein A2004_07540 [Spirochaetes bacterium GWC1_61_12]OHD40250.1 MAG: hypothetical protein A2087_06360 [Spirochaetes bacterium GWD1_61_31]OHD42376.1 MAG: hypothetical protein A2Y35_11640 [Spirochaetes bacterium GWE1_60_18]OHD60543.1 MAG: hypothetical protein A2Y32_03855 [Spirochaetes bacterium GWF1_60_12]
MRVMIAEDESIIALALSLTLRRLGHQVLGICASGATCCKAAIAQRPEVIFMDIRMAGPRDGLEAAAALKDVLPAAIVFTTAFDDAAIRAEAASIGYHAFLVKPVAEAAIRNIFQKLT